MPTKNAAFVDVLSFYARKDREQKKAGIPLAYSEKCLSLPRFPRRAASTEADRAGKHIQKSVYVTLVLDVWKLRNSSFVIKNKATINAHRLYVHSRGLAVRMAFCRAPVKADWVHMIGVGRLRCSFNDEGQCEGLQTWDE